MEEIEIEIFYDVEDDGTIVIELSSLKELLGVISSGG